MVATLSQERNSSPFLRKTARQPPIECEPAFTLVSCIYTCMLMCYFSLLRIIPQAICTRFGMAIGYYCSPIVLALMAVLFPIAFPIAKLLDCVLGKDHSTFFRRAGKCVHC